MKFHFLIPELRAVVEAETLEQARERLEQATCTEEMDDDWRLLGFNGEADLLISCIVCGCTDDMACEGGCVWVGQELDEFGHGLCSFEDDAHAAAREKFGLQDDGVPLVFEVRS